MHALSAYPLYRYAKVDFISCFFYKIVESVIVKCDEEA
jgi:hypothetical protein